MNEKIPEQKIIPDMGEQTSKVFAGEYVSETNKEMYAETAQFFADEIRKRLPVREQPYIIADIGSYKGELLVNILKLLPDYHFETVAVDVNKHALSDNSAGQKIIADSEKLPFVNNSVDLIIIRYLLAWNNAAKQKRILEQIAQSVNKFALVEHAGADINETEKWREKMDDLLNGIEVPKMKRSGHFFSSRDEIETWLNQSGISFERLKDRVVQNGADVYIERYGLNKNEAEKTKEILGDKNYFRQTDWIVYPL